MEIKNTVNDGITIVKISGNLDGATSTKAQETIEPLLTTGCKIIFDMQSCQYVSSAGLRILLMSAKQLKRVDGHGVFSGLSQEVNEVMQMTGFDNIFQSYDSLDIAKEALRKE